MIQLDAALMAAPVRQDGSTQGRDGEQGDFLATLTSLIEEGTAATTEGDAAELLGEPLSEEALAALAEAGAVLGDEAALTEAESAGELLAGLAAAVEDAELPAEGTALWRLQAALYAAAHGQPSASDGSGEAGETTEGGDGTEVPATVPAPTEGTADEATTEGSAPEAGAESVEAAAAAATAGATGRAASGTAAEVEADASPEGQEAGRTVRAGVRGAERAESSGEPARPATAPTELVADDAAGEGDEAQLQPPGRERLASFAARADIASGRGERVDATVSVAPETVHTATRSEVSETGATRPSAAAAMLERVLEAAARLERMPPPRQLTLEVGESRVRLGLEDGALRVHLLGDGQPDDRELLRAVTTELRNRGFNLGEGHGGGSDHDSRSETATSTPATGDGANPAPTRSAPRMPAHATTDLRL